MISAPIILPLHLKFLNQKNIHPNELNAVKGISMNPPGANPNPSNVQVPLFAEKGAGINSLETLFVVSLFFAQKEAPRAKLATHRRRMNLVVCRTEKGSSENTQVLVLREVVLVGCSNATHSLRSFKRILTRMHNESKSEN